MRFFHLLGTLGVMAAIAHAEIIPDSIAPDGTLGLEVFKDKEGSKHLYVIDPVRNKRLSSDLAPTKEQIKAEAKDIDRSLSDLNAALELLLRKDHTLKSEVIWRGKDAEISVDDRAFRFEFDIRFDRAENAYITSSRE